MPSTPATPDPSGAPKKRRRTASTSTSAFGVSKRESHDSSEFYARFAAPDVTTSEAPAAAGEAERALDDVFCGDSRSMGKVADRSVALVVTSPPYFAGKEYEEALGEGHVPGSYLDYLEMLTEVFAECVRTLEPGGRIAVNVANLGRRPYRSLSADVIAILQDRLRLLLRGEVIWQKQRGAAGNCAWGSFQRPGNPVLRDLTERVVVASKGRFDRAETARRRDRDGLPSVSSLTRDEFMDATLDVWELPAESATRVGHPAPFPVALPERLIHLYTYVDDLVLDPFMGSGTTGVAAVRTGRHFVGYDTDPAYVERARGRIQVEVDAVADGAALPVQVRMAPTSRVRRPLPTPVPARVPPSALFPRPSLPPWPRDGRPRTWPGPLWSGPGSRRSRRTCGQAPVWTSASPPSAPMAPPSWWTCVARSPARGPACGAQTCCGGPSARPPSCARWTRPARSCCSPRTSRPRAHPRPRHWTRSAAPAVRCGTSSTCAHPTTSPA